jgi:hypothetical protein
MTCYTLELSLLNCVLFSLAEQGEEKMKRIAFIILVLVLWLATWKGASPKAPAPDSVRASVAVTETTVLPTPGQNLVP